MIDGMVRAGRAHPTGRSMGIKKNGLRVLVVDDQPFVCSCLKMLLEHDGYEVSTCQTGDEARDLFRPGAFDLVLTDFDMPGITGLELASILRSRDEHLPIIVVTAYTEIVLDDPGVSNVDGVLPKPFLVDQLRGMIDSALAAHSRARSRSN